MNLSRMPARSQQLFALPDAFFRPLHPAAPGRKIRFHVHDAVGAAHPDRVFRSDGKAAVARLMVPATASTRRRLIPKAGLPHLKKGGPCSGSCQCINVNHLSGLPGRIRVHIHTRSAAKRRTVSARRLKIRYGDDVHILPGAVEHIHVHHFAHPLTVQRQFRGAPKPLAFFCRRMDRTGTSLGNSLYRMLRICKNSAVMERASPSASGPALPAAHTFSMWFDVLITRLHHR